MIRISACMVLRLPEICRPLLAMSSSRTVRTAKRFGADPGGAGSPGGLHAPASAGHDDYSANGGVHSQGTTLLPLFRAQPDDSVYPRPGLADVDQARRRQAVHRDHFTAAVGSRRLRSIVRKAPQSFDQGAASVGRPAACHSGRPSSRRRTRKPRRRSAATASNDSTQ